MGDVLIVSANADFAEPLARLAAQELGSACRVIATAKDASAHCTGADVLVSDMDMPGTWPLPVIRVSLPVRLRDLLADIVRLRAQHSVQATLDIGGVWQFSALHKTLTHRASGGTISLTDKEIDILQMLAVNPGKNVSRELLLKTVWGIDSVLDTHTLETHIYRLRNKLRELPDGEQAIVASDGGYILNL